MVVATKHDHRLWRVSVSPDAIGQIKLDIGCGQNKREGFIGLDIQDFGQEIFWDVENGIPLPDNACVAIWMRHALEHFDNPLFVINECWRVLKKGGCLEILVPHYTEPEACSLLHTHLFSEDSFKIFDIGGVEKRYGVKPWRILELSVGTDKCPGESGQKTIYVQMEPVK